MPRMNKAAEKAAPVEKAPPTLDELMAAKAVEKGQKWRAEQEARHAGTSTAAAETLKKALAKAAKDNDVTPDEQQAKMDAKNAAKYANWAAERERKHAGVG